MKLSFLSSRVQQVILASFIRLTVNIRIRTRISSNFKKPIIEAHIVPRIGLQTDVKRHIMICYTHHSRYLILTFIFFLNKTHCQEDKIIRKRKKQRFRCYFISNYYITSIIISVHENWSIDTVSFLIVVVNSSVLLTWLL